MSNYSDHQKSGNSSYASSSNNNSRGGKRPSRGRGNYHHTSSAGGSGSSVSGGYHHHHASQPQQPPQQQQQHVREGPPKYKKKQPLAFVKIPSSSSVEEQEAKKQKQETKIVNNNTINDEQVDADDELGLDVADFIPTYINRFRELLTTLYSNSQLNQDQLLNIANRIWSEVLEPTLLAELNPSLESLYTASSRKGKLTNFIGDKDIRLVTVIMGIDKLITKVHHSSSIVEVVPEFILHQKGIKVEGDDRIIELLPQFDTLFFEILTHETRRIWRQSNSDMSISISNFETDFNKSLVGCNISQFEKQIEELKNEIEQLKKSESIYAKKRKEIENEIDRLMEKSLDLIDLVEEAEKEEKLSKRTMSSRSLSEESDETTEDEAITPKTSQPPVVEQILPTTNVSQEGKTVFLQKIAALIKVAQAEETESSEKLKTYSTIASMIDASFNYFKDKSNQTEGIVPLSYSSISTPTILFLLDFFKENPEKIPSSVISKVLSLTSCSLKGRRFEEKNEIFARYHVVLMHFTKYLTIRKMELFMNLMNKISSSLNGVDSEFIFSLLKQNAPTQYRNGNTLMGFSDRVNLVRLWQVQAFCATLVMTNPKLANQIFTFYERHCLSWMNLWEEIKNVCLRETSLTAVKKKKQKNDLASSSNVASASSSEKEESEVVAVASQITEKVQSQVAISESLETDIQNIETQLGKSPEVLKQEAEEHTMLQITRDCTKIFKEELEPSEEERKGKKELVDEISQVIQSLFSSNQNIGDQQVQPPKIYTYGSYASDLSLKGSSDIDMCVSFAGLENIQENSKIQGRLLEMIRKEMDGKSKKDTNTLFPHLKSQNQEVIRSSRVPILKIHDNKRDLDCDLCVATYLGVVNTRMISTYLQVDSRMLAYYKENGLATLADSEIDRIKTFIYMIKRWAKRRHINDPPGGSLSSYSYVLMCLQFLQHLEILPSLQQIAEDTSLGLTDEDYSKPQHVNAYNTKYLKNLEKLPTIWKAKNPQKVASYTLGHLIYLFFEFYAKKFDFDTNCISIRAGSPVPKKNAKTIISLEDPFEIRDLGCVVSNEMGPVIVSEFRRSHEILSAGGSINDLLEEREGVSSVNIYQMKREVGKQGYDDYLASEAVDEMLAKGELYQGELRVNKKRFTTEAYVSVEGFKKDVLVEGLKNRNRAMHGDVVAIKIQKTKVVAGSVMSNTQQESAKSPEDTEPATEKIEVVATDSNLDESDENVMITGVVVSILKKKSPSIFPCTLMAQDDIRGYRWLLPLEKTYPKLNVPFEEFEKQFNAKSITLEEGIFVVEMKPWNKNSNFPKGAIIGCLGLKKDLWSLKRALLLQYCPIMFDNIFSERKVDRDTEKEITSATSSSVMSQSMAGSTAGSVVAKSGLETHADDVKRRSDYGQNQVANIGDTISDIKLESVSSDEIIQIQDWRESRRIFTIDPTESRDLDDAIAIEPILENGQQLNNDAYRKPYAGVRKFLVTVAIADVSQFVPEGSPIDKEARKRGTSVYMVNSVEHMLDPSLSQNLCSLHGGVNRFGVAVEFVIDRETATIEKSSIKFNRCMMRSACRLDYNRAQKMIVHYKNKFFNGQNETDPKRRYGLEPEEVPAVYGSFTLDEIYEDVQIFNELSQKLRKQRADKGSIFLQNEQLRFECDMDGKGFPLKVACDEHNESHMLIEEMMLVANELAATVLNDHFGDATLLRVHSSPKVEKWAVTVSLLADKIYKWKLDNVTRSGIAVEAEKEKAHVLDKLEKCVKHVTKGAENNEKPITIQNIINLLIESTKDYPTLMHTIQHSLLREMQLAQYATVGDCKKGKETTKEIVVEPTDIGSKRMVPKKQFENTWHFALCKEFYTHFTSPIRRYADLVVHRLLLQMIREKRLKEMNQSDESILSKRETSLSAQEISSIAEHLNDQAYRARLLQDECEKQYLAYYLWPKLSKSVERVEAVVLSMGKRSFTLFVPKYGLELQVNAMKHFSPTPTTLKMDEIEMESLVSNSILKLGSQSGEDEDAPVIGGTIIEKLTITWSGASQALISVDDDENSAPTDSVPVASQHNKTIELKPLKQVLVDLDINTSSVPLEIICYNIWEKDENLINNEFSKKIIDKNTKAVCSRNAHGSKQFSSDSTTAVLKSSSEAQGKQMEKLIDNMQKINRRKKFFEQDNNNNSSPYTSGGGSSSSGPNNNFERRGKPFARGGGNVNSRGGGSRRQYNQ
ncbi:ribonuclease II family protein [Naegleria gruberi]|uniref:Ribonuclease II family protein n=1 Tax=Naegleria gruberi TaxID=5762 RepID=D2W387_NAEGR|nr:ribonuclease II family protein [Naegleria gruberi]EFC36448.1 ribonuclease II family protein [Naegleria gruberi]|eukprot:XP_002669192.1 ribonuclease II family protein [Naegleria gruberi strain NEG-M]